jgi:predicted RNA-binding protein (virulence factor B family)
MKVFSVLGEKIMFATAKYQVLEISHQVDFGLYLKTPESESEDVVLLPKKEIPENFEIGDKIKVYIYRDSEDRQIATTRQDLPEPDEIRLYQVLALNNIGAFMDWGLSKDLFLPHSQQRVKVKEGRKYLAAIYVDKSDRICATTYIEKFLKTDHNYVQGDAVSATVYRVKEGFGAIVAVDNSFMALLPHEQVPANLKAGEEIEGFVARVLPDGKIDFSLHKVAYLQRKDDASMILEHLQAAGGFLALNDKSSPQLIDQTFGISKKAFKRAVGNLLRQKKIVFEKNGIKII